MAVAQEIAQAGKFLTEALTKYETEVTPPVYAEHWGYNGLYHEAIADLPFGTRKMSMLRKDYTGKAANYGGKATTLPLANFGIDLDDYKAVVGAIAADWNWQELRSEEAGRQNPYLPSVNVSQSYREAADMALQEWMHLKTIYGDPTVEGGFTGLINNPFVETVEKLDAANGLTGSGADAASAYDFMITEASDFRKTSKLTTTATTVLTSEDVMLSLNKRFADNSNDGNPLRLLTGGGVYQFSAINSVNEMDGETATTDGGLTSINGVNLSAGDDYLLMFDANVAGNITRHYHDMDHLPPGLLDDQMTYRQVCLCATSEVIFKQPFKARLYILRTS